MAVIDGTENADIITPSQTVAGQSLATDGDDSISGHGGGDTLDGGLGNDTLQGGAGADKLEGGKGINTVSYSDDTTGVVVDLTKQVTFSAAYVPAPASGNEQHGGDAEGDLLAHFQNIIGGSGADTLTGDKNANVIDAGSGTAFDTMDGGAGNDTVSYENYDAALTSIMLGHRNADGTVTDGSWAGGSIVDFENLVGTRFDDDITGVDNFSSTIDGGTGDDYIAGGTSADKLSGGAGDDTIAGGGGKDVLDGGTGDETDGDTLDYSYLNSPAKITVTLGAWDADTGASLATKTSGFSIDTVSNFENIEGGLGNDTLTGNDATNHLLGNDGDDVLNGAGGKDFLEGKRGNDTLIGGDGADTLFGGDDNDVMSGDSGSDIIAGGDGDDIIEGGEGTDLLDGGDNNEINGDTVSFAHSAGGVVVDLGFRSGTGQSDSPLGPVPGDAPVFGETVAGFENIIGSAFDDSLFGTKDSDPAPKLINRIDGGAGNDFIAGGAGADLLIGGAGSDTLEYVADETGVTIDLSHQATLDAKTGALTGGTDGVGGDAAGDKFTGFENIAGGAQGDTLTGDKNANIIVGFRGDDVISGGDGNDTLGGDGLVVGLNANNGTGSTGDDNIDGGAGNDLIIGDDGTDTLKGGIGTDTLTYRNSASSVFVDLTLQDGTTAQDAMHDFGFGSVANGDAAGDILSGFEAIVGSNFDDDLSADTSAANKIGYSLTGGDGEDRLHGGFGKDTFSGGADDDEFVVGLDHSVVKTGGGGDVIDGGDGSHDLASFGAGGPNHTLAGITITLGVDGTSTGFKASGGDATGDKITNVEDVSGTWLVDKLTGNNLDNMLSGGAFGDDVLAGMAGDDTLVGIHDNDRLIGGAGNDILDGGDDTDTADYSGSAQGVTVNLSEEGSYVNPADTNGGRISDAVAQHGGDAEGDRLWGIESVIGSAHDDILTGGISFDDDVRLDGGAGNDLIIASDNNDSLIGGTGIDTLSYQNATADVAVDLSHQSTLDKAGNLSDGTGDGDAFADKFTGFENVTGGSGNDQLIGDKAANIIIGGAGNDILTGNTGDDTLTGGVGENFLDGGAGNDTASYSGMSANLLINLGTMNPSAEDTLVTFTDTLISIENIIGGTGIDSIVGSSGINILSGGGGADYIAGGEGNDIISGGAGNDGDSGTGLYGEGGNDTINGDDGDDAVTGGAGADKMDGGAGNDALYYMGVSGQSITVNLAKNAVTAVGAAALLETKGDTIKNFENALVGDGNNTLIGDAGSNVLVGGAGNDTLDGGGGGDLLAGGAGNDTYIVDSDMVLIFDNAGSSGGGIDTVRSSATFDLTIFEHVADLENLTLTGTAAIDGTGNALDNVITGNSAVNALFGLEGNDTIIGGLGADIMDGDDDIDTLSYVTDTKGVTVDLDAQTASGASGSEAAGDTIANFENVIGGKGIDHIIGSTGDNVIAGGLGNDVLDGGEGSETNGDTLDYSAAKTGVTVSLYAGKATGGDGADSISNFENVVGTAFNDVISGSADVNNLAGGGGNDTLDYSGSVSGVNVSLAGNFAAGGDAQGDTISSFENVNGGGGSDDLFGSSAVNVMNGLGGDDVIQGSGGADILDGGADNDYLSYTTSGEGVSVKLGTFNSGTGASAAAAVKGGDADGDKAINFENIWGSDSNDILIGNNGVNTVLGVNGDDLIAGGLGADLLSGGNGNDTVDYSASSQMVTVSLADQGVIDMFGNILFSNPGTAQHGGDAEGDLLWGFENIIGSKGNDTLTGDGNANTIAGGLGNDDLDGSGGTDMLDYSGTTKAVTVDLFGGHVSGGAGNDTVTSFENVTGTKFNDIISGSDQANVLIGGGGIDTLDYSASANGGINVDLMFNSLSGGDAEGDFISGFANINGTNAGDVALVGDNNANVIKGNGGDDLIMGRGGADTLDGGSGNETQGDTVQYAESFESVTVTLGTYNSADGTSGTAKVSGGDAAGDKVTNFENLNGSNNIGDRLTGNTGVNRIKGLQGDDVIAGGAGDAGDLLDGGAGNDTVDYSASAQGVTVSLAQQGDPLNNDGNGDANLSMAGTAQSGGDAAGDLLWNFENIIGSKGNDVLTGDDNDNVIIGGLGVDTLDGRLGNDTLDYSGTTTAVVVDLYGGQTTGGAGTDTISNFENVIGTAKNDTITGSAAVNTLDGRAGIDTLDYSASANATGVTIDLGANTASGGDAAGDIISGFENINGTSHSDFLVGSSAANIINGGDGSDTIEGGAGADKMDGGDGTDDVLSYFHSTAAVTVTLGNNGSAVGAMAKGGDATGDKFTNFENLTGGQGNDILTGNAGANVLSGRDGNDTLTGGAQVDIMTGGDGADIFNYLNKSEVVSASDHITDFTSADGDQIGIKKSGFGIASGINATTFDSQHYFDDQNGHTATGVNHAQFIFDNATGELYFDADGQAGGEVVFAHLDNVAHMSALDFLLK